MRTSGWLLSAGVALLLLLQSEPVKCRRQRRPNYLCDTDADCKKHFPGTVCIIVELDDVKYGKCTPNTKDRPACRGSQPGLCPSYQDPSREYLNAHCVFVAVDDIPEGSAAEEVPVEDDEAEETKKPTRKPDSSATSSAAGSAASSAAGSGVEETRRLMAAASEDGSEAETPAASSGSTEKEDEKKGSKEEEGSSEGGDRGEKISKDFARVVIGNKTYTGQFKCVDVSNCENVAADPTTCEPKTCGASSASKSQCNDQGTCTYPSIQTMSRRRCMCYKGFEGNLCQKEVSGACDVDCGQGGDCVKGKCVCKAGFDGKEHDGKKGKPDQRCRRCTSDLACENDSPCDIQTGRCQCKPGYKGPTCGGSENGCTKITCGNGGNCQLLANQTGACFCPLCNGGTCTQCEDFNCYECPSAALSVHGTGLSCIVALASAFALNMLF